MESARLLEHVDGIRCRVSREVGNGVKAVIHSDECGRSTFRFTFDDDGVSRNVEITQALIRKIPRSKVIKFIGSQFDGMTRE